VFVSGTRLISMEGTWLACAISADTGKSRLIAICPAATPSAGDRPADG
jgi:hypothetical protein